MPWQWMRALTRTQIPLQWNVDCNAQQHRDLVPADDSIGNSLAILY